MLERFFRLKAHRTTVRTEVVAGITTFVTMAYIIVVNPKILEAAGIPFGPSMVATIVTAFFGTLLMGLYANRPFAIAPYMGENAFIAFTVVKVLGYSWQTALGAIFVGGVLFTVLTLCRLRQWLAAAIPPALKYSFAVGIGLFLTFIGLNESGIVSLGVPGAPVRIGILNSPSALLAIGCFLLIGVLLIRRIKGAILIGMLATTGAAFLGGAVPLPERLFSMPPSLAPVFLKLDIAGALTWGFFAVILTVFVMDFVDTLGTLIGVSARAGFLDPEGNLPDMDRPLLVDALSTMIGAVCGTTTAGAYIESAAGIEEGGRTGLTSCVTAGLFLLALFCAPVLTLVPAQAYGPALVMVGLFMFESITKIRFTDYTEAIPAFVTVGLMSFTYNIGIGITAGFVLYPALKAAAGRVREVHAGGWVLCALSVLFFAFYPY